MNGPAASDRPAEGRTGSVRPSGASGSASGRAAGASGRGRESSGDAGADAGWAGGVMAVLRWVTRMVEVNVLVVLGTLAGGVLLGLGPALRAGSTVLLDDEHADAPWRGFWRTWRSGWRRANLLFAPVWVAGTLVWLDTAVIAAAEGPARAAFQVGLVLVSGWGAVVLAWWPRVALRYDDGAPAVWRFLLLAPILGPGTALAVLVALAATAAVALGVPLAAALAGVSFPLWATGRLVDDRLRKIDERAADAEAPR
ncbi:DUF624 domain-containing protein [Antribacter gilvus]|uniref:DUF624 domain-containing protein n=1 Tax=Antribacter gilvus TaxID=2304675 RepID=UPI000F7AB7AF|nr:DUF624 domain-containing protein [Antribacter gilvus]